MTNLQKYPNTQDALNAWTEYLDCDGVYPFAKWINMDCADVELEEEVVEEGRNKKKADADTEAVLDAAESVVDAFRPEGGDINQDILDSALKGLCRAVWKIRPRVPSAECGGETDTERTVGHA